MIRRDWSWLVVMAAILTPACGGQTAHIDPPPDAGSTSAASSLPACGWPASLDHAEVANGKCVASRTYLTCQRSDGEGETCLSDNATSCLGDGTLPGVTTSCRDLCHDGEFAVSCGGPGPAPPPPAPVDGCRSLPSGPGGGSSFCCPCGPASSPPDAGGSGGSFPCGAASCDWRSEICEHVEGGAPPGVDFYECSAIPETCTGDVSCTCVVAALWGRGAGQCAAAGGGLTVQIDVP